MPGSRSAGGSADVQLPAQHHPAGRPHHRRDDRADGTIVEDEILGLSEGVPGQRFNVKHRPVVPTGQPVTVEVAAGDGWQEWTCVSSFGESGPDDRDFLLDPVPGEIIFGPGVREPDGLLRQYGAVPPKGAAIRVPLYRNGGGRKGNVARGAISVLKSSIPYVARVENRRPATGGVDAEEVDAAKVRGRILLRTHNRAVTAEDYEQPAKEAAPDVARVRCLPARFEDLVPSEDLLTCIQRYLDAEASGQHPEHRRGRVLQRCRERLI